MTLVPEPQDSLLAATNPGSLNELMNRDPMNYTKGDLMELAKYFRGKRELWKVEEAKAPAKAKATALPKKSLSLADLKQLKLS